MLSGTEPLKLNFHVDRNESPKNRPRSVRPDEHQLVAVDGIFIDDRVRAGYISRRQHQPAWEPKGNGLGLCSASNSSPRNLIGPNGASTSIINRVQNINDTVTVFQKLN